MAERPPTLILGVGNDYRGDDAVGLVVARRLQAQAVAPVVVQEANGEGVALMDAWQGAANVVLVDAVFSGGMPGTVYRLAAQHEVIPAKFFHYSTHAFSVAEAIELARALGQLPPRLVVYGIEGQDFCAGADLSPAVAHAAESVVAQVMQELAEPPE